MKKLTTNIFFTFVPMSNTQLTCITIIISTDMLYETIRNRIMGRFLAHYIVNSLTKKYRLASVLSIIDSNEYIGVQITAMESTCVESFCLFIHELEYLTFDEEIFNYTKNEILLSLDEQRKLSFKHLIQGNLNYYLKNSLKLATPAELHDELTTCKQQNFQEYYQQRLDGCCSMCASVAGGINPENFFLKLKMDNRISYKFSDKIFEVQTCQDNRNSIHLFHQKNEMVSNNQFSFMSCSASVSTNLKGQWIQRILRDYLTSINGPLFHMSRNNYDGKHACSYVLSAHSAKLSLVGAFIIFWQCSNRIDEKRISDDVLLLLENISQKGILYNDFKTSRERVKLKFINKRTQLNSLSHFIADNMIFKNPIDYRLSFCNDLDVITYEMFQEDIQKLISPEKMTVFFKY